MKKSLILLVSCMIFALIFIVFTACETKETMITNITDDNQTENITENIENIAEKVDDIDLFLPNIVEKVFFEEKILANITDNKALTQIKTYYILNESSRDFNIPVYIIDPQISEREKGILLENLRTYTNLTGREIFEMCIDFDIPMEMPQFLVKTFDEKHDRYNFSYKRSVLSIRKEIFEQYELTDEHIQNFFETAEIVYDKLTDFFPEENLHNVSANDLPKVFIYNAVPKDFSEPDLYDDYGDRFYQPHPRGGTIVGWADTPWTNETFYEENFFATDLSRIETGFTRLAIHELGHLFNMTAASPPPSIFNKFYVWDIELFANLAEYYIASELTVINSFGEIMTAYTPSDDVYWNNFFALAEKYGYAVISDTLKEMFKLANTVNYDDIDYTAEDAEVKMLLKKFDLFKQVLSQKTGDNIQEYYDATPVIYIGGKYFSIESVYISLPSANLGNSDIEPLRNIVNLFSLDLTNNHITDISPLAEIKSLGWLYLNDNQISDINALAGLTNLSNIDLRGNPVSDISVLAELKNLTWLGLANNQISDFSVLSELNNLTGFIFSDSNISDVSMLTGLTNLTHLLLYNNQISDTSELKKMTNLIRLDLTNNPLTADQIAELREALPNTEIVADY